MMFLQVDFTALILVAKQIRYVKPGHDYGANAPLESDFNELHFPIVPVSVVGIATRYGLDGPGIESRWVARFSAPVQTDRGAHQASCTVGTGSSPGGKAAEAWC